MSSRQGQTQQRRVPTLDMRSDIAHSGGEFAEVLIFFTCLLLTNELKSLASIYYLCHIRLPNDNVLPLIHLPHPPIPSHSSIRPPTHVRRSLPDIHNYARMLAGGCSFSLSLTRCSSRSCGYSSSRWAIDGAHIVFVAMACCVATYQSVRLRGWPLT